MADNRLEYNDNQQGLLFNGVVKGALAAVGVGLLAAHQPWGRSTAKYLNQAVYTVRNTFGKHGIIGRIGKDLGKWTKSDAQKFYSGVKQNWEASKINANSIRVDTSARRDGGSSLANRIQTIESARIELNEMVKTQWANDRIRNSKYVQDIITKRNFDKNTQRSLQKYSFDILGKPLNLADNEELARRFKFNENPAVQAAARDIMNFTARTYKATMTKSGAKYTSARGGDDSDYLQALISTGEKALEDGMSVDALIRNVGSIDREGFLGKTQRYISGSRKMTFEDMQQILQHAKDLDKQAGGGTKNLDAIDTMIDTVNGKRRFSDYIEKMAADARAKSKEEYEKLLKIAVDESALYVKEGNGPVWERAFSKRESGNIWRGFLGFARNTLPGKLLKIGDIDNALKMGGAQFLGRYTRDPVLQARMTKELSESDFMHFRLGSDIYRIDHNTGQAQLWKENVKLVHGYYGFHHTIIEALSGQSRTTISDNPLYRGLDIFQDRSHYSGNFMSDFIGRFTGRNERRERYYSLLGRTENKEAEFQNAYSNLTMHNMGVVTGQSIPLSTQANELLQEYMRTAKGVSQMFKSNTYDLNASTIDALMHDSNTKDSALDIYKALDSNSVDEMLKTLQDSRTPILNKTLSNLLTQLKTNPVRTRDSIELVTNESRLSFGSDLTDLFVSPMTNETYGFNDVLRREMTKEALLRQGFDEASGTVNYDEINDLVKSVNIDVRERKELDKLVQHSIFQRETGIDRAMPDDVNAYYNEMERRISKVEEWMQTGTGKAHEQFRETYDTLLKDEISSYEGSMEVDAAGSGAFNEVITLNRSASPLDIVKSLNHLILTGESKPLKDDVLNIYHGLTAGRNDMEHVNLWTEIPFFTLKRLSDELNTVGLGFSSESMSSTGQLAMAFMTKRILPVAIGSTYLDWADDTTREATGTGLWQAFTAGVADVDLAGRKVISGLGMDSWLKQTKAVNPIWQYWGDKDEYQSYEERQEYYRNGYTPVRKAAWWTWGGVSEARGGEIQYWLPNIVRRAASNAYDESMYDGYFDKWSHSWLPTPTNPLSPIFAALDPYWLERKHSEDRPYAISGPMFEENTPWGAVLNPTIGNILKPEKELHDDDYFFFGRLQNGIDILSLMKNANDSIRARARNFIGNNYISIRNGDITAVDWNVYNAPTPDTQVLSLENRGSIGTIHTGIYGVYGDGSAVSGIGSSNGAATNGQFENKIGSAIGEGSAQDISAGFNAFSDDNKIGLHLLTPGDDPTVSEMIREALFLSDKSLARHGDIVQNEKGELGIYHSRRLGHLSYKPYLTRDSNDIFNIEDYRFGTDLSIKQRLEIEYVTQDMDQYTSLSMLQLLNCFNPRNIVRDLNQQIIKSGQRRDHVDSPYNVDESEGFTSVKKLSSFRPSTAMELLNDPDMVSDLITQGQGADLVENMAQTARLIGGIYGYMGSELGPLQRDESKRLQQSSDMTSYTRQFWDQNLGGLGGSISEIGRRFIPNFSRMNKVSPLLNTMPDWLPEKFRYGDPFSGGLPYGEMRLPGKGYKSVNDLHPDQFSTEEDPYGAFDRMKILADVAPNSAEYKLWRNIVSKTVIDPELRDEMEDIKSRARQQGKKHDFYDYNVIGQDLNYENVIVSEILDYGKFRSGNRIFKVAGVSVKANAEQSMKEVLGQYIHVGQEITIATDTNPAYGLNRDLQHSINAAVFVDGESVGNTMLESGDAVERKGDKSSAAKIGSLSALQYSIGYASEFLAHLDIPIISDQWLRIRSPYESYLAEQVYGTPYQSWSHPIDTFLMPAVERAIHDRSVLHNIASSAAWDILHKESIGGWTINPFGNEIKIPEYKLGRDVTHKIFIAHLLTDRAALVGTAVSNLFNANDIKMAQPSARHAERLVTAAHVLTGGNSMIDMGAYGAWLGNEAARIMEVDVPHRGKWWLGGTAAAMGYRLLIGQAGKEYVPDRVERNWGMQEYWDRLTYIKYEGLYKEAARRAEDEEGVDIEEAIEEMKEREAVRQNSIKRLKYLKKTLGEAYDGKTNAVKDHLLKLVNSRLDALASEESMVEGGKYTQTALIYKRAADSTMQGLHENAGWSQIISALPQNDREYFMEFVAERDKDKREKILNIVSPSLRRALKMSWGMKTDEPISNEEYFEDHYLPDSDWAGWHPDVDLKDIEVKTINNEAMNLSDFGFYESQLRNPGAVTAAPLPYDEENDSINMSRELRRILKEKGLKNVEVDVVEKNTMGPTDIIANLGIWMGVNHQRHIENAMIT